MRNGRSETDSRYVEILAHRGGADGRYPENSIAAFETGIAAGADILEMDVHHSRDGEIVVVHDAVVADRGGEPRGIADMALSEIRALHDDSRLGVPRLADILSAFRDHRINVDLKRPDGALARHLADTLREYQADTRATVASFHPVALDHFRRYADGIETSTHPEEVKRLVMTQFVPRKITTPAAVLQIPRRYGVLPLVTRRFVRYVHRHGFRIHVWTINEPRDAVALARIGVDGIVTDRVAAINSALTETGFRKQERRTAL